MLATVTAPRCRTNPLPVVRHILCRRTIPCDNETNISAPHSGAPRQPHPSAYSPSIFPIGASPPANYSRVASRPKSDTTPKVGTDARLSEHRRRSPRQAAAAHGAHRVGHAGAAEWGKRCPGSRRKESRSCPSGPRPADKQAFCSTGACARCDGRLSASGTLLDRFYRIGTRCADNGNFVPPSKPAIFLLVVLHTVCRIYSAFLPADIALAPRPNPSSATSPGSAPHSASDPTQIGRNISDP